MRLRKLDLTNFRSYESLSWTPDPTTSVLIGPNGAGKSNVLEAVYMLATTKSHRTSRDADVVRLGADACRIAAEVEREKQNDVLLEIQLGGGEKSVRINKAKPPRLADMIGQFNAVIFSTADVEMVKGEPSGRRRFLNLEISQVRPKYCFALARYKRVLDQRNSLLRDHAAGRGDTTELAAWDQQLVEHGSIVVLERIDFCREIGAKAAMVYEGLTGGREELQITYDCSFPVQEGDNLQSVAAKFAAALSDVRLTEVSRGVSLRGPQRDDLRIIVGGRDVRYFGSRGQQRAAALAIKLAEAELIRDRIGEYPVVLLDDVASELDPDRRGRALELLSGKGQAVLTTTSMSDLPTDEGLECAIFEVREGGIVTPADG